MRQGALCAPAVLWSSHAEAEIISDCGAFRALVSPARERVKIVALTDMALRQSVRLTDLAELPLDDCIALSESWLAMITPGAVKVWHVETGRVQALLPLVGCRRIDFVGGLLLAHDPAMGSSAVDGSRRCQVYDPGTCRFLRSVDVPHSSVAFRNGDFLVVYAAFGKGAEGAQPLVCRYDLTSHEPPVSIGSLESDLGA
ncbi:MAG: hypothetical protein EOO40_04965, partial [Deltaproteobacteria bacterium]